MPEKQLQKRHTKECASRGVAGMVGGNSGASMMASAERCDCGMTEKQLPKRDWEKEFGVEIKD